jgi:superfamily I DNA/RNA helicase
MKFSLVQAINVLASKSTAEIRAQMKKSGLFNYRDGLLLELLNSEVQTTDLMQSLQQISLEAIAGSSKLRDAKTIENLLSKIIEPEDPVLQKSFLEIFQNQLCKSSDNLKYIGKLFEDQKFVGIVTTKSLSEIEEYLKNNQLKDVEKIIKLAKAQNGTRRIQKAKDMNERSQKRNKVYAELTKEKTAQQTIITDYNVIFP